jgi:hypothetical protein
MSIRSDFPEEGNDYLGGESDGLVYKSLFAGRNITDSFEMIKQFLKEEGYADVPLPANSDELLQFRLKTRNKQILLFEDNGYVHNPVKILFPIDSRNKHALILLLYNEKSEGHLLRFHRKI